MNGSSPRERGTRITDRVDISVSRFIPARAGNTANAAECRRLRTVHPRASGEH